jgi:hypothetical protein
MKFLVRLSQSIRTPERSCRTLSSLDSLLVQAGLIRSARQFGFSSRKERSHLVCLQLLRTSQYGLSRVVALLRSQTVPDSLDHDVSKSDCCSQVRMTGLGHNEA